MTSYHPRPMRNVGTRSSEHPSRGRHPSVGLCTSSSARGTVAVSVLNDPRSPRSSHSENAGRSPTLFIWSVSLNYSGRKLQHSRPRLGGCGLKFYQFPVGQLKHTASLFLNTGGTSNFLLSPKIVVFGDSGNRYNFPKPGSKAKHTVKIRTADARKARWGAWSPPVEFGRCPGDRARTGAGILEAFSEPFWEEFPSPSPW